MGREEQFRMGILGKRYSKSLEIVLTHKHVSDCFPVNVPAPVQPETPL